MGLESGFEGCVGEVLYGDVLGFGEGGGDAGALADEHPGGFDAERGHGDMGAGQGDRDEQVVALGGLGEDGAIGNVIGVADALGHLANGEDGAFVDDLAIGLDDAAAVVRVDGE